MPSLPDLSLLTPRPAQWDAAGHDHARRWAAHLAAGRLGTAPPAPTPAQAATLAANDALFRARAARLRGRAR